MTTKAVRSRDAVPWPLVDSDGVLAALDPARRPTRGRLRHARESGWATAGILCRSRAEDGRLAGTTVLHSALAVWAARLHGEGQDDGATRLMEQAALVERRFGADLTDWLSLHSAVDLPTAPFFGDLTRATRDALVEVPATRSMVMAAAKFVRLDEDDLAVLEGSSPSGRSVSLHLPHRFFVSHHVEIGDWVLVLQRMRGSSVQLDVDFAVPVMFDEGSTRWLEIRAGGNTTHPAAAPVGDDGLTATQRQDEAQSYVRSVQGLFGERTGKDLARRLDAGTLPRRRLRPLG